MIVSLHKSRQPSVIVLLPLLAMAIWSFSFFQEQQATYLFAMPLHEGLEYLIGYNKVIENILAMLMVIAGAFLLNSITSRYELMPCKTYLPALLYVLFISTYPSVLSLHPPLIGNIFLLLTLRKVLTIYSKDHILPMAFDAGLYVGIASLLYLPYATMFGYIWVSLLIFRRFIWREWLVALIGLAVPWLLTLAVLFVIDRLPLLETHTRDAFEDISYDFLIGREYWYFIALLLPVLLLSLGKLFKGLNKNTVHARKNLMAVIWFFVISLLTCIIMPVESLYHYAVLVIPLSAYATNFFLSSRRVWIRELVLYLMLAIIFYNHWMAL